MIDAADDAFLAGLPVEQQTELARVNAVGLARLGDCLTSGEALAFLGAGASAPLYPLWGDVILRLVSAAASRGMTDTEAATCVKLAPSNPDTVVEIVRQRLRPEVYREVLREVFAVRRDPETGRTWTATQELIVRCNLRAVVTTNYDPGIVNARIRVRPSATATGFASWTDELALDGWRTGDVFHDPDDLPVLFAHGHHNQPDSIVLATTEYRRAYAGKLPKVLGHLIGSCKLVWIGFSFADQRIGAILREIAEGSGTRLDPGAAPRHVAIMAWDPCPSDGSASDDPAVLRDLCSIQYGADLVLYPAPACDHSALEVLLECCTDQRFGSLGVQPPAVAPPRRPIVSAGFVHASQTEPCEAGLVIQWVHGGDPLERFTGRAEELARLGRWLADREVRVIGVTAWGGAGKTALITEWLAARGGASHRPDLRGIFAWSFYENPSEDEWAESLLDWGREQFGIEIVGERLADRVLKLASRVPLVLVLDGLERVQDGPGGLAYGRLLGGLLRSVLTSLCRFEHRSIGVLTSRFVFADLEQFDGTAARMLDVPAFTLDEGSELLGYAGAGWLSVERRRRLVEAVHGHALAVDALAGALEERLPTSDITALVGDLALAGRTDARVQRVLTFYAERLSTRDRALTSIVALFQRPVTPATVLTLGASKVLERALRGWTDADVQAAVQQRLGGLLSWHADGTVSAHPLVRDSFRVYALSADSAKLASALQLSGLPEGAVRTREDVHRIVEIIELLLDAGQWHAADELYRARTDDGRVFKWLPAAWMGQRCALSFVLNSDRPCGADEKRLSNIRAGVYLNEAGLHAMNAGDLGTAARYLEAAVDHERRSDFDQWLPMRLLNWSICLMLKGHTELAVNAATEALMTARRLRYPIQVARSRACMGWALHLAGQTAAAETHFRTADRIRGARPLASLSGCWWGQLLVATGRAASARKLTLVNLATCTRKGWSEDVARCERLLARCDLAMHRPDRAAARLRRAVATFRDGDFVLELADTLIDVGEQQRLIGCRDDAEHACTEAIQIAAPRELAGTHAAALATRARVRADHKTPGDFYRARDDADHAHRLASKIRQLPWQQLNALEAHAHIDRAEGVDNGWRAQAESVRARLVSEAADGSPGVRATYDT